MDLYFRRHEEYIKHYNCSFYSVNQISLEERKRPFVGVTLLVLFVIFELLYLPCAIAMFNKQPRKNFCYKVMLLMTIFDMLLFFENALFPGYASLHGYQPCDLPHAEFLIGLSMLALWMGYSTYCIILAVNRCLVFTRFSYLFTGKKEYFWLGSPIVITVLIFIVGKPGFYSSVQCAYFFSPHYDYYPDTENYYPFKLHTFNNIMFSILIPVIYLSYFIMNCLLSKQRSTGMSKREYSLVYSSTVRELHHRVCLVRLRTLPICSLAEIFGLFDSCNLGYHRRMPADHLLVHEQVNSTHLDGVAPSWKAY
ncbi:7TM GPCR, serpentine receptor class t (Srt) family-containing protein [Aphelenchoides bicaudatus]|nr:7TM GPCR, serpentine receptor class t (Srt) family-containing protein [Aphelenchoides bicaudatus]